MNPLNRSENGIPSSSSEKVDPPISTPSSSSPLRDPSTKSRDTVESNSISPSPSSLTISKADIPTLPTPASTNLSIAEAFRTWTAAIRGFKGALKASAESDLDFKRQLNELSINQASEFLEILKEKENLIANLDQIVKAKDEEFENLLLSMGNLPEALQKEIDKINAGNKTEQVQQQKIADAYQNCLDEIRALGGEDLGNGQYSIPPGREEKYSKALKKYQKAISSFNQYWGVRSEQISSYNAAAETYNKQAGEANLLTKAFILDNDLSDFLQQNGIAPPELATAQQRDISDTMNTLDDVIIAADGSSVYIPPLPSYMTVPNEIAVQNLPPNSIEALLKTDISTVLHDQLYERAIAPLDHAILHYSSYISFAKEKVDATGEENNEKLSIFKKEEKEAAKLIKKHLLELNRDIESSLALERINLDKKNLQIMMGSQLMKMAILNEELGSDLKKTEALAEELTEKILFLSVGLLSNLSVQSLFPSMGLLADEIDFLPKESPAYTLLFAVSLANRICENIHSKLTDEAVSQFLSPLAEAANLPPEALSRVQATLNIGQLMVAGKLLEESLGLTGLLPSLLSSSSPSLDVDLIMTQAAEEDSLTKALLEEKLYDHFLSQGYPEDKAIFLAQGSVEINSKAFLAPPILGRISGQTIDLKLMEKSLGMELALIQSISLPEGINLSSQALSLTLEQGPFHSQEGFRTALKSNLADLGVPNSQEIALALPLHPLAPDPVTYNSDSDSFRGAIERRIDQLLPQLKPELKKEIGIEISNTILGSSLPSLDLTHILQQEIARLKTGDDAALTEELHATFIESIKTMTSFPDFALKLLDPAHQYLTATSLIYRKNDKTNRGDIPI